MKNKNNICSAFNTEKREGERAVEFLVGIVLGA